ncbi:MAG: V-type ATP synthase subunit E [Candidatus Micrarchaeota archaeon]
MGLQQLCTQIEQNSKVRAAAILQEAKAQARKIVDLAKKSSSESIESSVEQAGKFCDLEAKERENAAQLEASKLISDAKDEAVRQSLVQAWDAYSRLPKSAGYKSKLAQWAQKALGELSLPGAIVRCREEDAQILSQAGFRLGEPLECLGGVRAESKDGRVMVDYTLEAQFESKKEELAKAIYSSLFANLPANLSGAPAGSAARPKPNGKPKMADANTQPKPKSANGAKKRQKNNKRGR